MSKMEIDDLLDSVSQGDIDHPVFGKRYAGEMRDDEFLERVSDYVSELQASESRMLDALLQCIEVLEKGHCSETIRQAHDAIYKRVGD